MRLHLLEKERSSSPWDTTKTHLGHLGVGGVGTVVGGEDSKDLAIQGSRLTTNLLSGNYVKRQSLP